jgi:hypothetical protein
VGQSSVFTVPSRTIAILVLLGGVTLIAQPPPRDLSPKPLATPATGTGSIRGRVVAAGSESPLRNVRVAISAGNGFVQPVVSDESGRYAFSSLPAGRYSLTASKAGYATTRFGARRFTDRPIRIDVENDRLVDGIDIRMPKGGAISGRVADDIGEPMPLARVVAQLVVRTDGRTAAVTVATGDTDDLGEYRMGGLPAGKYAVGVLETPNMSSVGINADGSFGPAGLSWTPSYYPAAQSLAQAQLITVRPGDEATGIDLTAALTRQATLSITVVDADGNPAMATLGFGSASPLVQAPFLTMAQPQVPDGARVRLQPADWVVLASGPRGIGMAHVALGSEDAAVRLTLVKGGRIAGRLVPDNGSPLPPALHLDAVPVDDALRRARFGASSSRVKPDGTFEISGLLGARELRLQTAQSGWIVKDVLFEGRSLGDVPVEFRGTEELIGVQVILTNQHPTLSGTVVDAQNAIVSDCYVLAFPESQARLRNASRWARMSRPDRQGRFMIDDALPGAYLVVAVDDLDDTEWLNAVYLNQFRGRAVRVTLGDRENKTMTLPLVSLQ